MSNSRSNKLATVVLVSLVCLIAFTVVAQAENVLKGATVVNEIKHDVSLPLSEMAKLTPIQKYAHREIELRGQAHIKQMPGEDPVIQRESLPLVSTTGLLNFDGQGADGVAPPDTEGAVGATQYVQWVNLEYNVYNKTTGAKVLGPIAGNALWSGFGGQCQSNNDGDPIVLYDKVAGRWFFAQNVFSSPYTICIAVSTSNDATGSYNRYSFPVPNDTVNFPDYPKWGVWPDAYYQSYNIFTDGEFANGVGACAANRTAMLAGNAATLQCFSTSSQYFSLMPADQDGLTPPPTGEPNTYVSVGSTTTSLNLWQFHVDFTNPSNSTFTGPTALTVPNYTLICTATRACVPEPSPGEPLDVLGGRVMYRFAYRNFGTYESLLISNTVKPGTGSTATAAVRWYEIRNPSSPTLFQSGTIQHPIYSVWMSSMAQDKNGDIALGLSASATSLHPSVGYLGRVPTDPLGSMESPKTVVVGTGSQEATDNRWGDYSAMQIDPSDDCTFWYTQEYIKTTGSFNWSTRINSFKFNSCN